MDSRQLFCDAICGKKTERPPLWIMRQAGRYLPEYIALKERYGGFLNLVKTPELALQAALQPIERFGFDCAILFSDILVLSEALGYGYNFIDGKGLVFKGRISSKKDVENLNVDDVCEKLEYVLDALKLLRNALPKKAVLGFSASPFTLGAYLIEGESSKDFPRYKAFMKNEPELFAMLMQKLSAAVGLYVKAQLKCNADAIQIFDSHSHLLCAENYWENSGKYIKAAFAELPKNAKTILFALNASDIFGEMLNVKASAYSVNCGVKLSRLKAAHNGRYALQGNLNNAMLEFSTPRELAQKAAEIVEDMKNIGGHIFNLGHGITPNAKLENVYALCNAVIK
ncbi:MAG: uroporphyrinogen decarboxylase [Opitutales bacterium]|nr:uroporphyrinogen decarboxylase [Opitutales bacterium]